MYRICQFSLIKREIPLLVFATTQEKKYYYLIVFFLIQQSQFQIIMINSLKWPSGIKGIKLQCISFPQVIRKKNVWKQMNF